MKDISTMKKWRTAESRWEQPGLHRINELKWEKGSGVFEGCSIAMVAENKETGEQALYLKVMPHKEDRFHYHTATTHSLVLRGSVAAAGVDGEMITCHAGDYFRSPANWVHQGSHVDEESIIFTFIERPVNPKAIFGTVFVDKKTALEMDSAQFDASYKVKWHAAETHSLLPGLHRLDELNWREVSKKIEGFETAIVCEDLQAGKTLAYMQLRAHKEDRYHIHSASMHSVVIKGAVSAAGVDGEMVTLNQGDYFRCPENWLHKGSHVDDTTLVFTMRVNPPFMRDQPETLFVQL